MLGEFGRIDVDAEAVVEDRQGQVGAREVVGGDAEAVAGNAGWEYICCFTRWVGGILRGRFLEGTQ